MRTSTRDCADEQPRVLPHTLALVDTIIGGNPGPSVAVAQGQIPMDLPPLVDGHGFGAPSSQALQTMGTLYLMAELEQAGIIPTAELLVEERNWLPVTSVSAAEKLDRFARRSGDWYDQKNRNRVFARVFGLGIGDEAEAESLVNHDFQRLFASVCLAMVRCGQAARWGRPGISHEASLRQAARALLANLASRQFGNTLLAARAIKEQLDAAIDLLSDPGIGALFRARGLWDTLRKILGSQTPDLGRHVDRGQSGLRLLAWLASVREPLWGTSDRALLSGDAPVLTWAATWLQATGIEE